MKKLTHTSPFLLLLFPVFMLIAVTFIVNLNQTDNSNTVFKPTKTTIDIVKKIMVLYK